MTDDPLLARLSEILDRSLLHREENHAEEAATTEAELRALLADVAIEEHHCDEETPEFCRSVCAQQIRARFGVEVKP